MYLHLGGDRTVLMKDVIAIVNIGSKGASKIIQEFLRTADEEGFIEKTSEDNPKTIVLAEVKGNSKIYLSPISSVTLLKRSSFIEDISNTD